VPCGRTAHANELIRIVDWPKLAGVNDVDVGAAAGARGMLDRPRRGSASGLVVIEAQRDGFDAEAVKPLERLRPHGRPAESCDVRNLARAKLVDVEEAFDEHDLAPRVWRSVKEVGETVGRQVRATGAAEVEVTAIGSCLFLK
jgi:hypothetical protein